ncbi:MAG: GIY-YIG nuclease family protein [Acidobacteriota bacterium]|nr:GIY-YIG nuclease family protein [Acidobacteriota bacterium]
MKPNDVQLEFARMWPRDVFYRRGEVKANTNSRARLKTKSALRLLFRSIDLLSKGGVYILYRDDVPYYVGQATRLRTRLWSHACNPDARHFNHWNFFSAFVINSRAERNYIESILIAAMPTANGMKPLKRQPLPSEVVKMIRQIHFEKANPAK